LTIPTLSGSSAHPRRSSSHSERRISSSPFYSFARVLLVATICGAPWAFGAVDPWAWGALIVMSLLILILWAVGCAHRGVLKISWSPLYLPFLAFLILALVQYLAGLNADHVATREAVLKIVTNLVFFFLAGQLLNAQPENGRALEWLGLIAALLAIALSILGLAQMFWGANPQIIYWTYPVAVGSPFGPYVNHNDYAGLMEMLLPISVAYTLSRSSNMLLRFLLWSGVILGITSIWVSGSRGGTLVLLIEGLLLAGILLVHRPRGVSPSLLPVLLGVVLVAIGAFSWMVGAGHVGSRAWSIFETNRSLEVTLGDRLRVGIDTLHIARSHLWMGVGVGCFEQVFPKYMTFPSALHWTHAHDDILEAVAETGLPGAALILLTVVLFFREAFRRIEERMRHGWGWIQMGAAVGTVGLFFHSFVDFNLRVPANAAWFVLCLAVATHPRISPDRPQGWPGSRSQNSARASDS
jgi:O-antigen ligase